MTYCRRMMIIGWVLVAITSARADMIVLEGVDSATVTTGDLLDGAAAVPVPVSVAEVAGLQLTAWSGGAGQIINTTSSSLGINLDAVSDDMVQGFFAPLDDGELELPAS